MNDFDLKLRESGDWPLRSDGLDTLQLNLGRHCNQTCLHCHVEAGPTRTESMARQDVEEALAVLKHSPIGTLDLTGGAPELHPDFEYLVDEARTLGRRVVDRCNLTVLLEPGQEHLISFLCDHQVTIVASLPYFLADNVDRQRGVGVFARSIHVLRLLNAIGYGVEGSGLQLDIMFNSGGAFLPGSQASLERQFRAELGRRHSVVFSRLLTLTNMPMGRFGSFLRRSGNEEIYWRKLRSSFNPATVPNLMCRRLLSVGRDGRLHDCDFNQMVDLTIKADLPQTVRGFDYDELARRAIVTAEHCFGCTAGSGSSCGGALA
ncbi:MAG: arsenosugar biosynthesis radical SAM protein ArsS [Dehalococcoidia bacterium]|nr:arsenosugar biosynthesis radical SAM protein ArsS [Dehalococcoidia bacterium]